MIRLLTILAILLAFIFLVTAPYLAALLYTIVSLLQPQFVWFWAFDGIPIFKISAGLAIIAWAIMLARGQINWQVYNNGIFFGLIGLLIMFYVSNIFSPFPSYFASVSSSIVLDIYTTIFIMFFIILGIINSTRALKLLVWTLIAVTIYYTWWSNINYFESNWSQFVSGRLEGPRGSPYRDGNIFSILYVIGLPFILFAIFQVEKKWQKLAFILVVPFLWHALVLYASRGALLSAGVATMITAWMIKSKSFNILLVCGFIFFIIDQGGQVISRATETVQRAENSQEEPINPRIISWQVGLQLIQKHPILGVGPQRFLEASAFYFPGRSPHVAHNTFLNFSANTGLISGLIYLSFFGIARKMYKTNKSILKKCHDSFHEYLNKATITAMVGFFVGSMFLDLIIFEPFYFLLLIIVANNFILRQKASEPAKNP